MDGGDDEAGAVAEAGARIEDPEERDDGTDLELVTWPAPAAPPAAPGAAAPSPGARRPPSPPPSAAPSLYMTRSCPLYTYLCMHFTLAIDMRYRSDLACVCLATLDRVSQGSLVLTVYIPAGLPLVNTVGAHSLKRRRMDRSQHTEKPLGANQDRSS